MPGMFKKLRMEANSPAHKAEQALSLAQALSAQDRDSHSLEEAWRAAYIAVEEADVEAYAHYLRESPPGLLNMTACISILALFAGPMLFLHANWERINKGEERYEGEFVEAIGVFSIWVLAFSLLLAHLRSFYHSINSYRDKLDKCLADALVKNYTILRLDGYEHIKLNIIINSYFKRNQLLAFSVSKTVCLKTIEAVKPQIKLLMAKKGPLPNTHYLAESYRLLIAQEHLHTGNLSDVFNSLSSPFAHQDLQNSADMVLSETLLICAQEVVNLSRTEKSACYRLMGYGVRHQPDTVEYRYALIALQNLREQGVSLSRMQEAICADDVETLFNLHPDEHRIIKKTVIELFCSTDSSLGNAYFMENRASPVSFFSPTAAAFQSEPDIENALTKCH